jgi:hypothetical protein
MFDREHSIRVLANLNVENSRPTIVFRRTVSIWLKRVVKGGQMTSQQSAAAQLTNDRLKIWHVSRTGRGIRSTSPFGWNLQRHS